MKGLLTYLLLLLTLGGLPTLRASHDYGRPPMPYEVFGIKLSWGRIPWKDCDMSFETGWKLRNPEGLTCQLRHDGLGHVYNCDDWFSCRLRVDPLTKTLTLLTAVECEEP